MPAYDITDLYQGNDYSLTFQAKDSNNNPIDLTSYVLFSTIQENLSSPSGIATFSGVIPSPVSGVCQISLSYLQTSGLPVKTYFYWVKALSSTSCFNLLEGYLNVNP